jgi:hypothetical protein
MLGLNASKLPSPASNRPPAPNIPPGAYPARLVRIVLLGTQPQRPYKGQEKPPALEVDLTYELLDEFMPGEDGEPDETKPRWISENFTFLSLKADKAKSTARYYALDAEGKHKGDWSQLLGAPCVVTVINSPDKRPDVDRIYDRVSDVTAMRPKDAQKAVELKNPAITFDFYQPNVEVFNTFPEWLQNKIKKAVDYPGSALQMALGETKEEVLKDDEKEW